MTGQPKFEIQPLGYSGSNFASFFLTPQGEYGDLQSIPLNYRWSYTKIDGSGYTLIGDYQNTNLVGRMPYFEAEADDLGFVRVSNSNDMARRQIGRASCRERV